jgi:hypothetical protein
MSEQSCVLGEFGEDTTQAAEMDSLDNTVIDGLR